MLESNFLVDIDAIDQNLIDAATEVLHRNFHPTRHQVGAAVLCESGNVYKGINVEACGYGLPVLRSATGELPFAVRKSIVPSTFVKPATTN